MIAAAGGRPTVRSVAVRREWTAHKAILMHAVDQRRAQGRPWLSWLLAGWAVGGIVWTSTASDKAWLALVLGTGVPVVMLSLLWWVQWFTSIVIQCNPIAMHLAPQMRIRALRVTVAVWAAITIAVTLSIGVPIGYPGQVAVFTALALMEISATFNFWRFAFLIAANWLLWHGGPDVAGFYAGFLKSRAAVALGVLLVVLDGRVALHRMFGGPRRLPLTAAPQPAGGNPVIPASIVRLTRFFQAIASENTRGQPLISRVLGPGAFGGERLVLVLLVAVCLVMRTWVALHGNGDPHKELSTTRWFVLVAVLMAQGLVAFSIPKRFATHIGEQALVRLAPNAPASGDFNRVLARYFLRRNTATWWVLSASTLAALWIFGATAGELARVLATCSCALVLAAVPLADFARQRKNTSWLVLLQFGLGSVVQVPVIFAIDGQGSPAQWAIAALASVVLAGLVTWYRWRAMVTAAPAYPAGRFG